MLVNLNYEELVAIRNEIRSASPDPGVWNAYQALINKADSYLDDVPASVMDKQLTAPSGDKHDYYAIGNYSWPNPDTPDGMPYIRIDGYKNPEAKESDKWDKKVYNPMVSKVDTLALAYFYTGDELYASKAATLLYTWFIDPATRMNPSLNYAGGQPGVSEGVYYGIIETVVLIDMLDSVQLLTLSDSWTEAYNDALKSWFYDYTTWLLESDFGILERNMANNHGSWYAAQVAAFSKYTGHPARILDMVDLGKDLIESQIAADGSLPLELARSNSFMYSIYGLQAFTALARCAEFAGEDLWHYTAPNGRNLNMAYNFIAPYLSGELAWTWPSISSSVWHSIQVMRLASRVYYEQPLVVAAEHLADVHGSDTSYYRIVHMLGTTPTQVQFAFDDFDSYTTGSTLNGQSGGIGWKGAWSSVSGIEVSNTAITYTLGELQLGGGKSLKVDVNSANAFARDVLDNPDTTGQDYYVSFLMRIEGDTGALPTSGYNPFAGWQARDSSPDPANDTVGITGKAGKAGARVANADERISTVLEYGQTYFVVVQYGGWDGSNYQTATVWLNPDINDEFTADTSVKATKTSTVSGQGSDGFIGVQVRTVSLSEDAYYLFDDVSVGRTWREVVPVPQGGTDGFDMYWPGTALNGLGNDHGWDGDWSAVSGATVSQEEITYSLPGGVTLGGGNTMKLASTSNTAFSRNLLPAVDLSGHDYFVSFIFRVEGGEGPLPTSGPGPFFGLQALDATPSYANDTTGIIGKSAQVGGRVANSDAKVSTVLEYGQTYFMVVQYTGWDGSNYQTATVWLNPSSSDQFTTDPAIKASRTVTGTDLGSDGFIGLMGRTWSVDETNYYLLDDIRVGYSWGEVVP
ncbi:alginate lyase family protein [Ruficoccus sp. ZRK36]|uniref:alginate lyase family protein n=1 Tax=Ruficoccus sp. ZRK36 TaxID=2866311 RepID=UPI001C72FCBB|nr:alginate lyase family protein [Ruficoccus sp. ZRK36]QYY35252.1 alginate lyase family protein [Ruficoccus sp. ZRK36]